MPEIGVQSLGQKDLLEKKVATHSSTVAWRIPWKRSLAGYSPWGHRESDTECTHTHTGRRLEGKINTILDMLNLRCFIILLGWMNTHRQNNSGSEEV